MGPFTHPVCANPQRLTTWPLRAATRAAVTAAIDGGRIPLDRPVTVGTLTWVQNMGKSGVLEIVYVAEADPQPHTTNGDVGGVWDAWVSGMTGLEKDVLLHRVATPDKQSYRQIGDGWDATRAVAAQLRPGGVAQQVGHAAARAAAELTETGPFSPSAAETLQAARNLVGGVPWAPLVAALAYTKGGRRAPSVPLHRADIAPSVQLIADTVASARHPDGADSSTASCSQNKSTRPAPIIRTRCSDSPGSSQ